MPIGASAVVTAGPKAGHLCVINGFTVSDDVIVDVPDRPIEPPFGYTLATSVTETYFEYSKAAMMCGLPANVMSFICGKCSLLFPACLGLCIRYHHHLCVCGLCLFVCLFVCACLRVHVCVRVCVRVCVCVARERVCELW